MSAERSGKSHTVAWTLTTLVAALVFYLLSVAPLFYLIHRYSSSLFVARCVDLYSTPYLWAADYMPFMRPYEMWLQDWTDSN
ncbi:hypothetical protein AYO49_04915 [Verrucomicrobiaceae bacterium SCGC AG-212-N21]|nr:hypothetical protein AYO49_04915 [Verrucomicrobiaceae bacterium SCGC AG-212-N21]